MDQLQSSARPRRTRILMLTLLGLGMLLVLGSAAIRFTGLVATKPGKLVAREPEILWRYSSPEGASTKAPTVGSASGDFELRNVGGAPVRITEVEASCGCVKFDVNPKVIEPGRAGTVHVRGTPIPVGEQTISLVLQTDSPLSPTIELRLRALGWRQPPFILRSSGDLTYRGYSFENESREISVLSVIGPESEGREPIIKNDLSFLAIDSPTIDEKPYTTTFPGSILRI